MSKVKISVSNLFVIMEMNYFKKFDKVLADCWRSCNYSDFIKWQNNAEKQNKIAATLPKLTQIKKYEQKHKLELNLENNVKKSQYQSNNNDMKKIRDESVKKVDMKLKKVNKEDSKILQKLLVETTNTNYGTLQENSAIKIFENKMNVKIISNQNKYNEKIGDEYGYEWYLVGKVDGITEKGHVLEIKNRVNKLFYTVRNYEKPQIMVYLYLSGKLTGYLMEQCKDGKTIQYDIKKVEYPPNYYKDKVLPYLNKFKRFFSEFMKNDEWKECVIDGNESKLYKLYLKY